MLYRNVPKTGEKLSILGFGAMRLPVNEDGSINEEKAISQMHKSIDSGVNYIDTAWPYHGGKSEIIVGKALLNGYREKVRIADKLPTWAIKTREEMDSILDKQLEKLGVENIDYYLLHALEGTTWDRMKSLGALEFLEKAKEAGKITNIGFSFHGNNEDFTRIIDEYDWVFCQIQYNFLDTQNQAGTEGLKYAASKNIAVMVMEPLRGGNLSRPEAPPAIQAIWDRAETTRPPVEWALRWVWNHPGIITVLSGMNDEEHIAENIRIASEAEVGSMTDEELGIVTKTADTFRELMKVPCTGCQYCMPCPKDINIPQVFGIYNQKNLFNQGFMSRAFYTMQCGGMQGKKPGLASQCVSCGQCVKHCPQNIDIPAHMTQIKKEFEGWMFKPLKFMLGQTLNAGSKKKKKAA
jgi:predicted aldo/keto reductase-like oxidoreductase